MYTMATKVIKWVYPSLQAYGVFISTLVMIRRDLSSYECFIIRSRRLSNKLLGDICANHGTLEIVIREINGRDGDLMKQYEVYLPRILNDSLTFDQFQ